MAKRQYPYPTVRYQTISQIRAENKRRGGLFFNRKTMEANRNVAFPYVYTGYDGWYFVMCRAQFDPDDPIVYGVYKIFGNYRNFIRISEAKDLATLKEARAAAQRLANAEHEPDGDDTYVHYPRGTY